MGRGLRTITHLERSGPSSDLTRLTRVYSPPVDEDKVGRELGEVIRATRRLDWYLRAFVFAQGFLYLAIPTRSDDLFYTREGLRYDLLRLPVAMVYAKLLVFVEHTGDARWDLW